MPRFTFVPFAAAAAAGVSLSAPSAARADVKVVSHVSVSGATGQMAAQAPQGTQTVTTYYKGTKTRTETAGQSGKTTITIYDAQNGSLTIINPSQKTYMVTSATAMSPMMAMLEVKTTADVKPGGKTQIIAGKPAKNYVWHATVTMGMRGGAGTAKAPAAQQFTMKMDGEQWVTEAVKLPGGKSPLSVMGGAGSVLPGLAPLTSKLAAIKGLPLSATMTQSFAQGGGGMGGAGLPRKPIVSRTQVVSISEAPLPASLFVPPAGFRKVENKMPGNGGGKMSM